jgi:tRNA(adenine34) deaminase
MCAGAIMNARISKVIFGAYEPKSGACGSKFDVIGQSGLNHNAIAIGGVMEKECSTLIKNYFKKKR